MTVSTVAHAAAKTFDAGERYAIERQSFAFAGAKVFRNQLKWAGDLRRLCRQGVDVIHLGNIRPCGYAVAMTSRRVRVPYLVYVNGGDLLHERRKIANPAKRLVARDIMGRAVGIVSNSKATSAMTVDYLRELGVSGVPIAHIDLGTDPLHFRPDRDSGKLRARLGLVGVPLLLTVARLVPHKGQDIAIQALARLKREGHAREARYLVVGEGPDRARLRALAESSGVSDRVVFAGVLSDDDIAEAYATADLYVGLSRMNDGLQIEGFGISFVEAGASGTAVLAGDSGGVRSAVRDGETGIVVPPQDVEAVAAAMNLLLNGESIRNVMGAAGRAAVESHYNWDRVAQETLQFTRDAVAQVKGTAV